MTNDDKASNVYPYDAAASYWYQRGFTAGSAETRAEKASPMPGPAPKVDVITGGQCTAEHSVHGRCVYGTLHTCGYHFSNGVRWGFLVPQRESQAGPSSGAALDPAIRSVLDRALRFGGNFHGAHEPTCLVAPGWRMHMGVATHGSSKNPVDCDCWVRDAKALLAKAVPFTRDAQEKP